MIPEEAANEVDVPRQTNVSPVIVAVGTGTTLICAVAVEEQPCSLKICTDTSMSVRGVNVRDELVVPSSHR